MSDKEQQIEEIEKFIYDYVDSKQTERVISDMSDKSIEQFMFVEDGSLKEKDIKEIKRRNPEVKIVVYRQGSPAPIIHDL